MPSPAGLPRDVELPETEMNAVLRKIHDDVAVLRRYLVDYGFVDRPQTGRYLLPVTARSARAMVADPTTRGPS